MKFRIRLLTFLCDGFSCLWPSRDTGTNHRLSSGPEQFTGATSLITSLTPADLKGINLTTTDAVKITGQGGVRPQFIPGMPAAPWECRAQHVQTPRTMVFSPMGFPYFLKPDGTEHHAGRWCLPVKSPTLMYCSMALFGPIQAETPWSGVVPDWKPPFPSSNGVSSDRTFHNQTFDAYGF